jgi:hypothetical protein
LLATRVGPGALSPRRQAPRDDYLRGRGWSREQHLSSLCPSAEARRIARKREFHPTPKRGNWLNMAEIELGVLAGQCLDRRSPAIPLLRHEVAVWQERRSAACAAIDWRFSTDQARVKLHRLYPS